MGNGGSGRGVRLGRWDSRVRGLPEVFGELPVSCLAEEMETPGEGQVRALITLAGNPLVSTPNAERLQRAVGGLEFQLAIDLYVNGRRFATGRLMVVDGTDWAVRIETVLSSSNTSTESQLEVARWPESW